MRERGIRISEKHGVNPSLLVCPICGKDNGSIALVGRLPMDAEAPRHMTDMLNPCAECHIKYLKAGVMIAEAERADKGPKFTGRVVVVKVEAWERMFTLAVPRGHVAMMEPEAFQAVFGAVHSTPDHECIPEMCPDCNPLPNPGEGA